MAIFKRWDADEIKLNPYQRLEAHFLDDRIGSSVYMYLDIDATRILPYLKKHNTMMLSYFLYAIYKTTSLHPVVNRFVLNNRLYQRNHMAFSTVVKQKMTDDGRSVVVKWVFDKDLSFVEFNKQVISRVIKAKRDEGAESDKFFELLGHLPHFLLRIIMRLARFLNNHNLLPRFIAQDDPLHATAMIANLGSIKINAPYHHLYNWGTISMLCVLGKLNEETNSFRATVVVDERITDGFAMANALATFKEIMENPSDD
jgi:hypothetical protein